MSPGGRQPGESRWPADIHRAEIEERTRAGESCQQIADAITSQYGCALHYKTVSRKRCEWGLRTRAQRQPNKNPSIRKRPINPVTKAKNLKQSALKADITARTERGESALQIADEVRAKGHVFKKGVATVLRLQTFWGLIPYDQTHATKGRLYDTAEYREQRRREGRQRSKASAKQRVAEAEAKTVAEGAGNAPLVPTVHYPANCTFGPDHRLISEAGLDSAFGAGTGLITIQPDNDDDDGGAYIPPCNGVDDSFETVFNVSPIGTHTHSATQSQPEPHASVPSNVPTHPYSHAIMSANLMIDLSTSMLSAAKDLKDLLLAAEHHQPVTNSMAGLPPSEQEVIAAKTKLVEATRCAWDLAKNGVVGET